MLTCAAAAAAAAVLLLTLSNVMEAEHQPARIPLKEKLEDDCSFSNSKELQQ